MHTLKSISRAYFEANPNSLMINLKKEKLRLIFVTNKINFIGSFLRSRVHTLLDENAVHRLFVHFECTYRYNMKCSFCNVWRRNIFTNEASTLEFKQKLLAMIKRLSKDYE